MRFLFKSYLADVDDVESRETTLEQYQHSAVEIPISDFHLELFSVRTSKLQVEKLSTTKHYSNEEHRFKMGVFVLTETSAGFALFKAKDIKIFKKGDLSAEVETAEGINGL